MTQSDDRAAPGPTPAVRPFPPSQIALLMAACVLLGIGTRVALFGHVSDDFRKYLLPWWQFITSHGGYRALRDNFANYNVPYLYILVALTYLTGHVLAAIKAVSVLFDAALAVLTYVIVHRSGRSPRVAGFAGLGVFLLPTVVLNSAMWGQCDSIYAAFTLAGLVFLMLRRPWLACAAFGAAYAFKQQALFVFPLLLVLALRRELPWRTLSAIPAVFLLLDVPALLLGRPIGDLVTVYAAQARAESTLTALAPSAYALVPHPSEAAIGPLRIAGTLLAGAVVLLMVGLIASTREVLNPARLVLVATTFAIAVPFLLPGMHERYFFLADVLSVAAAFLRARRLWYLPLLVQYASLASYAPYLFGHEGEPQSPLPALAMLAALVVMSIHLVRELRLGPARPGTAGEQTRDRAARPDTVRGR
ncbi:hypothetical protein [Krasilnikovia sp. MM14-A1259]|uniref:hypothetical protein n=1 Tax=Krasilnikovia sp. MM14-A1259 TaxID=3373539 RepID=UPI0037F5D61E